MIKRKTEKLFKEKVIKSKDEIIADALATKEGRRLISKAMKLSFNKETI